MKAVLHIVILEYTLYSKLPCCIHFIHWCRDPGIENRDSIALKYVLNEIVVNAWVTCPLSEKKKLKNLRKFRDGYRQFVKG